MLAIGLSGTFTIVLENLFVVVLPNGLAAVSAVMLASLLTIGLAVLLADVFTRVLTYGLQTRPEAIDVPHRLVSQGVTHIAAVLAVGLAVGLAFRLAVGLTFEPAFEPAIGDGLAFGFAVGVAAISSSPWPRYFVACLLLARRQELPLRAAVFMDWAYEAGLLRLSGIAVQFRHREVRDWLIRRGTAVESAQSPPAAASAAEPA